MGLWLCNPWVVVIPFSYGHVYSRSYVPIFVHENVSICVYTGLQALTVLFTDVFIFAMTLLWDWAHTDTSETLKK